MMKSKTTAAPSIEEFKKILREKQLKTTPQRVSVHEAMLSLGHASADMVAEYISKKGGQSVTIASVYNILLSLSDLGIYHHRYSSNNFTSFQTPRQYACYCGIAPFEHTSGTSIKGRTAVSKMGNQQLKCELTMAARSAIIHDPWMKQYYKRKMMSKGNAPGAHGIVLNAIKFKLIVRMFSVVKSGIPYKVMAYC